MKRRAVAISVTDHAVIRYLERGLGINVDALRAHIAGLAENGAELGAVGMRIDHYKIVAVHTDKIVRDGERLVVVPTVLEAQMLGDMTAVMRHKVRRARSRKPRGSRP